MSPTSYQLLYPAMWIANIGIIFRMPKKSLKKFKFILRLHCLMPSGAPGTGFRQLIIAHQSGKMLNLPKETRIPKILKKFGRHKI